MSTIITIKEDTCLGAWQGIGGAITEATAYNYSKLTPQKQKALLDAYYGKDGLDYRWGRVSIGSNDFCLKPYEYTKRANLSDFSIEHDRRWVLPMLQKILRQKELKIIASPWSPPSRMKMTYMQRFGGFLKPWRYSNYAKYIRKWLEAYAAEGVKVNYLTPQNEPHAIQKWESCLYTCRAQRKLAYKYLATELSDLDVQLLLWDHNKKNLSKVADRLFNGPYVTEYGRTKKIAGLCYHWYNGTYPDEMWKVRQKYPDIMILSSEMCCGFSAPYDERDWIGAARLYYYELFSDINNGASAWVDWNMLLSWQGGPSYCCNFVKSPIILNEAEDDFILTPIYQALKKFAQLFPAGSEVIRCENTSKDVVAIARRSKNHYKIVLANLTDQEQKVTLKNKSTKMDVTLAKSEIKSISL